MKSLLRVGLATALLVLLAGCFAPAGPNDPRTFGHATWCGSNPPSGYCSVPEAN